jgi:GNAT superfamily N-acetyltransferase
MITIMQESFRDTLPELLPVLPLHYQELALNQDKVPLDPQYDIYLAREDAGELMFMVVRENGDLIGYFIGFVAPGLHYRTCLTLITDIFYVHPDHRGGRVGFSLFKAVEDEAKNRGVDRMFVGSKVHLDASWLFEKLGYEKVETYYCSWLGD